MPEHAYYFRQLGTLYRKLEVNPTEPLSPPSAAILGSDGQPTGRPVGSLWLLREADNVTHVAYLEKLQPSGSWRIVGEHHFRDMTVLHVERVEERSR